MTRLLFAALCLCLLPGSLHPLHAQPDPVRRVDLNSPFAPFFHGVASGDPLTDRVIIWTRVTPQNSGDVVKVDWEVATDTNFTATVQSGSFTTDSTRDHTVKVDVTGLSPDTWYYYRFDVDTATSMTGRTKTAPQGTKDSIRFAVVSCSDFSSGYFNAYRQVARRNDIEAVFHLGDYIYETGGGTGNRAHEPSKEILSLGDYRKRYSQYRLDPDLQAAHQQYPWIVVWDDHETTNNSYENGANNHDPSEGSWPLRKNRAKQAYFEWQPIRENTADSSIFRRIQWGSMVDFLMVDTRLEGRDEQAADPNDTATINDPNRTILGASQRTWLLDQLTASTAQWKVMGQQVMFAPLKVDIPLVGTLLNTDQWDGYAADRQRIYDTLAANSINDFVVLTGDIHTNWANDLPLANYDPNTGANSAGVEFVVNSVTTSNSPFTIPGLSPSQIINQLGHIKYTNLSDHGYYVLSLSSNRAQSDYFVVPTRDAVADGDSRDASWFTRTGQNHLEEATSAFSVPDNPAPLAPGTPGRPSEVTSREDNRNSVLLGAYPNPVRNELTLQTLLYAPGEVQVSLYALDGRQLRQTSFSALQAGAHRFRFDLSELPAGTFILRMNTGQAQYTRRIIKLD